MVSEMWQKAMHRFLLASCAVILMGQRWVIAEDHSSSVPTASVPTTRVWPRALTEFTPLSTESILTGRGLPTSQELTSQEKPAWDARIRERGDILRLSPDDWRLYYTGYDGSKTGIRQLGVAHSKDGLRFERSQPEPLIPGRWVEDVCVRMHKSQKNRSAVPLLMFAEGEGDQMQWFQSQNGIEWSHQGQVDIRKTSGEPIEPGPYGTPTLWIEDDQWHLFYERRDLGIWHATSADGKVWQLVQDEPVMVCGPQDFDRLQIAANQVFRHGGMYYMVFHGSGDATTPRRWATSLARSTDLHHWEKFPGGPLRPIEENKSSGIIVHDGLRYRLYTMHDQVIVHVGPMTSD